jgi:hypothetical protein
MSRAIRIKPGEKKRMKGEHATRIATISPSTPRVWYYFFLLSLIECIEQDLQKI